MQSLGVTNVRIMVPWAGVQPLHPDTPVRPRCTPLGPAGPGGQRRGVARNGHSRRAELDAGVGVESTPINGTPADFDRFAAFARRSVALRYGDKISAYEVWNEPNSIQFWNTLDPGRVHRDAQEHLHRAEAGRGATRHRHHRHRRRREAPARASAGLTLNPIDFVRGMYAAGASTATSTRCPSTRTTSTGSSRVGENLPWKRACRCTS